MKPAKRLGSEAEAKAWLDTVVFAYAERSGIPLSARGTSSGGAGGSQGATMIIEDFLKFQAEQGQLAAQHIKLYMRYLKRDFYSGDITFKEQADSIDLQAKSNSIAKEYGGVNVEEILPSSTHSRLVVLIHLGIGFVRIPLYYDFLTPVDRATTGRCIKHLDLSCSRTCSTTISIGVAHQKSETYQLPKQFGQQLKLGWCLQTLGFTCFM
jgi:fatty acid synthase subunit alpha